MFMKKKMEVYIHYIQLEKKTCIYVIYKLKKVFLIGISWE